MWAKRGLNFKTKKRNTFLKKQLRFKINSKSGVGGDRTLVPTSYPQVFYMFSF